jgi:O-antigen/teichoic acid export membrane protein
VPKFHSVYLKLNAPLPNRTGAASHDGGEPNTRVIKNAFFLGTGEILSRAIAFITTTYLARVLGPSAFGIIGFATALYSYFALTVSAGFNDAGSREVARQPLNAAALAVSAATFRLVLAVVALAGLGLAALVVSKPLVVKLVMLLTGLSLLPLALDTAWVYKGIERGRVAAVAPVIVQVVSVVLVLLLVRGPSDVIKVPVAQFLGELCAATLLGLPFLIASYSQQPDWPRGWAVVRLACTLIPSRLFRTIIFTADVVLIGLMLNDQAVGLYVAAYRIPLLTLAIAGAIHSAYLPSLTRAATLDVAATGDVLGRSLEVAVAFSAPMMAGGLLLAGPLLRVVFGPEYVDGAWAFRFVLVSIGFIFVSMAFYNVLLIRERITLSTRIAAAAAVVNIGLNLVVIPRYGISGAAVVTALAEGLILVSSGAAVWMLGIRPDFRWVLRPLIASVVMSASIMALDSTLESPLVLSIAVGGAVYVCALILLDGVPREIRPPLLAALRRSGLILGRLRPRQ